MHVVWILSSDYFFTLFLQFELKSFFGYFDNESEWTVGTSCAQLLLQFYSDYFETVQMSSSYFEDVHVVWI